MSSLAVHSLFDVFAWIAAAAMAFFVSRWRPVAFPISPTHRQSYLATLVLGSAAGAYLFGAWNLWASGEQGIARSIEGALFGGVVSIEVYKRIVGVTARTGARFAAPLAIGVAVGRIGCFLAGIEDFTYGTPTNLPWARDFGDGVPRHPVQLYESAAMTAFLVVYLVKIGRRDAYWAENGFYLAVGFYGAQRFVWEFLKPYGPVLGPFTIFHLLSLALFGYAAFMLCGNTHPLGKRAATA